MVWSPFVIDELEVIALQASGLNWKLRKEILCIYEIASLKMQGLAVQWVSEVRELFVVPKRGVSAKLCKRNNAKIKSGNAGKEAGHKQ